MPAFRRIVISPPSPCTVGMPNFSRRLQFSISGSITTTFSPLRVRRCASVLPTPPPPTINISIGITLSLFAIGLANTPVSITVMMMHKNTSPIMVSPASTSVILSAKYVAIDAGTTPRGPIAEMNNRSLNRNGEWMVDTKTVIGLTMRMRAAITSTPRTPKDAMLSNCSIAARSMKITESKIIDK